MTIAAVVSGEQRWHVEAADCFGFAARIPDGAVSLLWLDGPYWMDKAAWDTFTDEGAFLAFYRRLFVESARILATNGSLYVCTSTAMAARLEITVAERFEVLNPIHWAKPPGSTKAEMFDKESCRAYFPSSERIIFAERLGADGVHDLGRTIEQWRNRAGVRRSDLARAIGVDSRLIQFWEEGDRLPQETEWVRAMEWLSGCGRDLRREYESLRRPFTVSAAVPYTDTWTYATVPTQAGKHPCEKPPDMLRDVIAASSRPGDLVCELFAGSGVGGEQAVLAGRRYLGCDADPTWATVAAARIDRATREPTKAGRPIVAAPKDPRQLNLFGDES